MLPSATMGLFDRLKGDPKRRFARQVLQFVQRAGVARAWFDEEQFAIGYEREAGGGAAWLFLNNSYTRSATSPPPSCC